MGRLILKLASQQSKTAVFLDWKPEAFVSDSGFFWTSFGRSSGAPEGFRRASRRFPEENNKKTGNKYVKIKLFISQRLCTHSAFLLFHNPIFDMSTGVPAWEMIGCESEYSHSSP